MFYNISTGNNIKMRENKKGTHNTNKYVGVPLLSKIILLVHHIHINLRLCITIILITFRINNLITYR